MSLVLSGEPARFERSVNRFGRLVEPAAAPVAASSCEGHGLRGDDRRCRQSGLGIMMMETADYNGKRPVSARCAEESARRRLGFWPTDGRRDPPVRVLGGHHAASAFLAKVRWAFATIDPRLPRRASRRQKHRLLGGGAPQLAVRGRRS